ncbi:MAG: hypothetical protein ABR915_06995 [Thermoguttaceae bacterium]
MRGFLRASAGRRKRPGQADAGHSGGRWAAGGPGENVVTFGPAAPVCAVAFGPEGKTLAAGGYREVVIWDLVEARLAKRLGAGKLGGQVRSLASTADGRLLAAAWPPPGRRLRRARRPRDHRGV